jgi:hypothetical protein
MERLQHLPLGTNEVTVGLMPHYSPLALTTVVAVCAYYGLAWLILGFHRQPGTLVTLYEPPRKLSPAMLRYVWKERFDDRTFWAAILDIVAKGLATMHAEGEATHLHPTEAANREQSLPEEEQILLDRLLRGRPRKGIVISMLDSRTTLAASDMAVSLHRGAVGRWFQENKIYVLSGVCFSTVALFVLAHPRRLDQFEVLVLALAMMAPAAFYLFFLIMRARDLIRSLRQKFDSRLLWRSIGLFGFIISCLSAIALGGVVLGVNFGWPLIVFATFLTALNVSQLLWMKAPTHDGEKLLAEIEGFRLFLKAVERFPMQRADAPGATSGLYEKYLPYAVALEVEQAWGDQFLAMASTFHQNAGLPGAEAFYLGMWDGKPIEVMYRPQAPKGRAM